MSALRMTPEASEKILLAPSSGLWGDLAVLGLAAARLTVAVWVTLIELAMGKVRR